LFGTSLILRRFSFGAATYRRPLDGPEQLACKGGEGMMYYNFLLSLLQLIIPIVVNRHLHSFLFLGRFDTTVGISKKEVCS